MITSPATLNALRQRRPEWSAWLAVVEEALDAVGAGPWDAAVPEAQRRPGVPLLADSSIAVPAGAIGRLLARLIATAARNGTAEMKTLRSVAGGELDLPALFAASLAQRRNVVEEMAAPAGVDAGALEAVAGLAAVPFLQACRQRWAATIPDAWIEPYCPICGAWPALAEVRGIERSRFFRCGRCGAEWHAQMLKCPYCANDDHEELVTLVPEQGGATAVIDACRPCGGYVKALTRLQGCPPGQVMIEDLATVDLDLAAVAAGYARPPGPGHAFDVHVTERPPARRWFS